MAGCLAGGLQARTTSSGGVVPRSSMLLPRITTVALRHRPAIHCWDQLHLYRHVAFSTLMLPASLTRKLHCCFPHRLCSLYFFSFSNAKVRHFFAVILGKFSPLLVHVFSQQHSVKKVSSPLVILLAKLFLVSLEQKAVCAHTGKEHMLRNPLLLLCPI